MGYIKKLESGYWHYRISHYQALQWRVGTVPTMEDGCGSGWIEPHHLEEAIRAAEAEDPKGQPKAAQQGETT